MADEQKVGKLEEGRKVFSGLLIMVKLQDSAGEGNIMKMIYFEALLFAHVQLENMKIFSVVSPRL